MVSWFRISNYSDSILEVPVDRETEGYLFHSVHGREVREKKHCKSYDWYPTLEEAQAIVDKRAALRAQRTRENMVRSLGPELLTALVEVVDAVGALTNPTEFPNVLGIPQERGEEILAMIKKGQGCE
jgi:hypothetical protein